MERFAIAGIVTEYNPFHAGHALQVEMLRGQGYDAIVTVMSGPFVQRATPALFDVPTRAKAALLGGVDLVLRLPAPWATASAEQFARGGVGVLAALGCVDVLAFGAETADTGRLREVAAALESLPFRSALQAELGKGHSFAESRAEAAEKVLPGAAELLRAPNNILGIEYCKALDGYVADQLRAQNALNCLPKPLALPRAGAAHDGVPQGETASASWLREQTLGGGVESWEGWVPPACLSLYRAAFAGGHYTDPARWELALLARLRGHDAAYFAGFEGAGEGLEARLAQAVGRAVTAEELYERAKTRRFAHSRVRRLALAGALGTPAALPPLPPFLQVLAATDKGLSVLRQAKKKAILPISTSLARLARADAAAGQIARFEAACEDLFALCQHTPRPGGSPYTQPALMP